MKKRWLIVLATLATAGMLAGCSQKGSAPSNELNVEQYVTLGEYKGLEVKAEKPEVKEDELKLLMDDLYQEALSASTGVVVEDGVTDRPVKNGDIVNIDYEGKKDGVAFQGGTAQGAYLGIGSGRFIQGFEEGLVGAEPGETRDLNLRFPDAYGNEELAGKEVVFTVKVNYILPEGYHGSILSSLAMYGITDVTDSASLEQYVRDYLKSYAEENYTNLVRNGVMTAFIEQCTFGELPEELLKKYEQQIRDGLETDAVAQGIDADTYCMYVYGLSLNELIENQVPEIVKQSLAVQAVANRESLNIPDEELDSMVPAGAWDGVAETEKAQLREDYREYFLYDKVLNYLVENAVIVE